MRRLLGHCQMRPVKILTKNFLFPHGSNGEERNTVKRKFVMLFVARQCWQYQRSCILLNCTAGHKAAPRSPAPRPGISVKRVREREKGEDCVCVVML